MLSISNNIPIIMTETTMHEEEDLISRSHKDDDVACSNADFDLHISDSSDFVNSIKKDNVVNFAMLFCIMLTKTHVFETRKKSTEDI